jgi:membrane-bound lytic murein transglycosylase
MIGHVEGGSMTIDPRSLRRHDAPRLVALLLVALAATALVSCGGSAEKPEAAAGTSASASTTVGTQTTPDALGQQIGALYVQALSEVTDLLRDKPAAAQVSASVRQLKETYARQLVELGRAREALDASGRAGVDAAIRAKVDAIAGEPWYAAYGEVTQHYLTQDADLHALVASFNVIGQYANFDLLRQQEPDEATRLGVG